MTTFAAKNVNSLSSIYTHSPYIYVTYFKESTCKSTVFENHLKSLIFSYNICELLMKVIQIFAPFAFCFNSPKLTQSVTARFARHVVKWVKCDFSVIFKTLCQREKRAIYRF